MKPSWLALFSAGALLCSALPVLSADAPALAAPPTDVVQFDHATVNHLFAKGGPLQLNDKYKVMAGRRVAPGKVEIHTFDTDVFYIVKGNATFVTGGEAPGAHETRHGEFSADGIVGGTERHLSAGDVIIIPKGTPHQFTQVDGEFLYFVVKVTE